MIKCVTMFICVILAFTSLNATDLSVKLVYPTSHAQVEACRKLDFTAEVTPQDDIPLDRVRYYRNGVNWTSARADSGVWTYTRTWTAYPGYYTIFASVSDDSGNVAYSDTTWINVGTITTPNLVSNGTFSCGTASPWNPHTNSGAVAEFDVLDNSWLSEGGILMAFIDTDNPGSETWHVQVDQVTAIDSGHTYVLTFKAEASDPMGIDIVWQENGVDVNGDDNAYTVWYQQSLTVNDAGDYGPITYECNVTDHNNALRFNIGTTPGEFYLDDVLLTDASITAIPEKDNASGTQQPQGYILGSNYPNPFNSGTVIQYHIPEGGYTTLSIYNVAGQKIRTFIPGMQGAGAHMVSWDGKDQAGREVASGVYIYRIDSRGIRDSYSLSQKMILIK